MNELLNILQHKDAPIENEQLLNYLKGRLEQDAEHSLEAAEQGDALIQDALDGLRLMDDQTRLDKLTRELNQHLQQRITEQRTKRKEVRKWKDQPWILTTVITLLVLIIVCFVVLSRMHHS